MMQQLQQSIAVICADATKAYIRSDVNETINAAATQQENQQEQSSSSSKQIYNFLADHFQKLAETKQREQKIAVSRKGVEEVFKWFLEDLMMKKKQNDSDGKEESPFTFSSSEKNKTATFQEASKGISLQAYHTILSTSATPRVNQREITSMLESKNIIINTSALPEVFELARALQQVMQKRLKNNVEMLLKVSNTIDAKTVENACSSSSSTFGTTNSLLFLAVFSSLLSVKSLFELLSIIIENCNGSRRLVQLICVTFAAIDVENKNVWNAVVLLLGRSSSSKSLSVSDLVEQIPSIETMGHGRASTFVDDVEEELFGDENSSKTKPSQQEQQGPVVVSYDPEDEEGDGRTRREEEQENSDNDDDAEEQEDEEDKEDAATKNDFWAGLTSGPAS